MSVTICQVMGFVVAALGSAGIITATALDMWSTQDLYDNPVTAVFQYQGLWRSCVRQSSGFTECRPYFTILGLPAMFQAVRALMIVGIVLGVIGLLIAIFALKCIHIGSMEDAAKANMTLTSGIMFIVAGLCAIAGVSVFANMLVTNFWMTTANMYGGGAMGGMGGMGGMTTVQNSYKAVSYHTSAKNAGYKTAGYKSATGYDSEVKSKTYNESRRSDDGKSYPSKYDYV
uniref:Claudin n=1 Tax=Geotrypetes seraphini TaxID=260995 RepID=A0A6P8S9H2_GEOSA|nr:claudin-18 isoform X2 [Geotrypetes seraphini]